MSGYKRATVNISQDEYDRLRDADRRLRSLPDPSQAMFEAISQQSNKMMQADLGFIQQRQANFEHMVSDLENSIRVIELSTTRAVLDHEQRALIEAQNYAGCLWDHFDQVIAAHEKAFTETIEANHTRYQQELAEFSHKVRQSENDRQKKRVIAEDWLEAAETFCGFIEENYAHELFTPGKLDRLKTQLYQAQQNLENGLSEATIVTAQSAYSAFSDLRLDLERMQNEWQMLYQAAWEACSQILAAGESSQVVQAIDLDGNLLNYTIDLQAWSQGQYQQWLGEVANLKLQIENPDQSPDSEMLRRWLSVDLPEYHQKLQEIVLNARVNALNSQLRINIADLVVQALQEQGFSLQASDYEARDMRNAYEARLLNLAGNEVVVQVAPSGPALGANELHLQSYDREVRTEHELQRRWYEVSRSLSQYGLEVGPFVREDAAPYEIVRPHPNKKPQKRKREDGSLNGNRTHPPGVS